MSFPYYTQLDAMVCGSICLKIIVLLYGKGYLLQTLREVCHITRERVLLMGSNDAAESVGLRSDGVKLIRQQLREEANFPCIVHLNQRHFVVMMLIVQVALVLSQIANNHIRSWLMLYMTMCIEQYSLSYCRRICGTVMQEGYIFIDTIAANIDTFIDELTLGYNTKIGSDGHGLSTRQPTREASTSSLKRLPTRSTPITNEQS